MNQIWTPDNFHGFSFGYTPSRINISTPISMQIFAFVSTWDTNQPGSASDTVVLPLISGGSYNFNVDWGDGTSSTITGYNQPEVTHVYGQVGIYNISITGGITGWRFNNGGDKSKILEISNIGPLAFTTGNDAAFWGCSNLVFTSTGSLNLPSTTLRMFSECSKLSTGGNFNSWNTTTNKLIDASRTFESATGFDQNIGSWQMSGVTSLFRMFNTANSFNNGGSSSISGWNTSNVTSMFWTFRRASVFNQPISSWNTSKVTEMTSMFSNATSFNQPIGSWNTSKVTTINSMLNGVNVFDQDLSNWIVTGITDALFFMYGASGLSTYNYDRTLSGWAQQSGNLKSGVSIHFGFSKYSVATGQVYRNILIAKGWTITDGGSI